MFYVISYDIPDDKRRQKIAKTLLNYGNRVQYSVFEANIIDKLLFKMVSKLKNIIYDKEDSIRIYKICKECKKEIEILGIGNVLKDKDVYIL